MFFLILEVRIRKSETKVLKYSIFGNLISFKISFKVPQVITLRLE